MNRTDDYEAYQEIGGYFGIAPGPTYALIYSGLDTVDKVLDASNGYLMDIFGVGRRTVMNIEVCRVSGCSLRDAPISVVRKVRRRFGFGYVINSFPSYA